MSRVQTFQSVGIPPVRQRVPLLHLAPFARGTSAKNGFFAARLYGGPPTKKPVIHTTAKHSGNGKWLKCPL